MEEKQNSSGTNPWMVSTLILVGIIAGFGVAQIPYLKSINISQDTRATAVTQDANDKGQAGTEQPTEKQDPDARTLSADQISRLPDDDAVIGENSAPITMVEFSDFQCPFCARFFTTTFPSLHENYIKTGKVKLVYRDFPLDFHPQAMPAAMASECAHEQGRFREMHDLLFNNQAEWVGNEKAVETMQGYAKKLGLSSAQFNSCMKDNKYASEIRKDIIDGSAVGVSGTPSFFINGKYLSGALPYETVFKPILDAETAGKKWDLLYDALQRPVVKVY